MINIDEKSVSLKEFITLDFFSENVQKLFNIKLISESPDLSKKIYDQNLHRPGLALAGFVDLFAYKRVQVFGTSYRRRAKKITWNYF